MVQKRNILTAYLLSFFTFGIYQVYWIVQQKKDINSQGGEIPTAWLIIVPLANVYWGYKFCEGYSQVIRKDNNTVMWFLVYLVIGLVIPGIVQDSLNKLDSADLTQPNQSANTAQPGQSVEPSAVSPAENTDQPTGF